MPSAIVWWCESMKSYFSEILNKRIGYFSV